MHPKLVLLLMFLVFLPGHVLGRKTDPAFIREILMKFKVIPDIIEESVSPNTTDTLDMEYYPKRLPMPDTVEFKSYASLEHIQEPPTFTWAAAESGKFYLFGMVDPDVPDEITPTDRERLLWLVSNIAGDNMTNGGKGPNVGNILAKYEAPDATENGGPHRIVAFLYEQSASINPKDFTDPRTKFHLHNYTKTFDPNIKGPVTVNLFFVQKVRLPSEQPMPTGVPIRGQGYKHDSAGIMIMMMTMMAISHCLALLLK